MRFLRQQRGFIYFLLPFLITLFSVCIFLFLHVGFATSVDITLACASSIISIQAVVALSLMLYAWRSPHAFIQSTAPKDFSEPATSFTAIIPARHEEKVIGHTIQTLSHMQYPQSLYEVLIVCRTDDIETITEVNKMIRSLENENIKLILFESLPINKPHALNIGLASTTKEVVVVFDAEDDVHPDLFSLANTVFQTEHVDVLQCGVQLMNFASRWFSPLNILEYFFWFKSTLQFFATSGIVPLGGNTVFFKKEQLQQIGGWDEQCLTEDAEIGMRLCGRGANIRVVYDEMYATREEAPVTLASFVKQRTRWNQGFIQVLLKGKWLQLPTFKQKMLALYVLLIPEVQTALFLYVPISLFFMLFMTLPVGVALLSVIPLYLLILQLLAYNIGFYLFTRDFKQRYSFLYIGKILIFYLPYQLVLGFCASRAVIRLLFGKNSWEKTTHANVHRVPASSSFHLAI